MHLLVPFASDSSEACQHVLRDLALPHLGRLLPLLAPAARDEGDAYSFSPPHERALAACRGWQGGDGRLPFAAHAAMLDGVIGRTGNAGQAGDSGHAANAGNAGKPGTASTAEAASSDLAWGLMTPAHWQLGRDQVTLLDPAALDLGELESRALFASLQGLLASEGFAVAWGSADRWYTGRADLDGLATASLDRVIGRSVDLWLRASALGESGAAPAVGKLVRRLQSEAQLVFYGHAVNEAREERGALAVNSFWLSGCGRHQPVDEAATPEVDSTLRAPLLGGDWAAWAEAWQALDAGAMARLLARARAGEAATLTLCGERTAVRLERQARPLWQRLRGSWQRAEPHALLASL